MLLISAALIVAESVLSVSEKICVFAVLSKDEKVLFFPPRYIFSSEDKRRSCILHSSCVSITPSGHQTMVQIVLRLGSKRTTFPSAAFVFVLYMGFSNVACPLLFSWTEHPVYCALSVFLWEKKKKKEEEEIVCKLKDRVPITSTPSSHKNMFPLSWSGQLQKVNETAW